MPKGDLVTAMKEWESMEQLRRDERPCAYAKVSCESISPLSGSPVYNSRLISYAGRLTETVRRRM